MRWISYLLGSAVLAVPLFRATGEEWPLPKLIPDPALRPVIEKEFVAEQFGYMLRATRDKTLVQGPRDLFAVLVKRNQVR